MGQTVLDFGITCNFDFVSYLLLFHVLCSIPQTTNIQIGTWVFFHTYCSLLHFPIPLTYNSPCLPAFCFTVDAFLAFSCVCVTQSTSCVCREVFTSDLSAVCSSYDRHGFVSDLLKLPRLSR